MTKYKLNGDEDGNQLGSQVTLTSFMVGDGTDLQMDNPAFNNSIDELERIPNGQKCKPLFLN